MRISVDMDLDDLAGAVCCADEIDCLREVLPDDDLERVLDHMLSGSDIEEVGQKVKENIFEILEQAMSDGQSLTRDEVGRLEEVFGPEVTIDTLREHGIGIEGLLRDEKGEYELVPAEDPRQMTLFDETGLPPPMRKRYIN